jgi:prolyl-tRNA editing enzyme YbaK/EbsC (Cys-tRNA(Pro) deacylase)
VTSPEPLEADDAEAAVHRELDRLGIAHEILPCDPALADTAQFCAHYGYALDDSANTIVVVGKSDPPQFAACVVLASTRLDVNRTVRRRLGTKKASFASAEETRDRTGMVLGGVTAIGLPADLPLWIDRAVLDRERIILGGGSRRCKVRLAAADLLELAGAEVVDGLAQPAS